MIEAVPEPGQRLPVQKHHEVGQDRIAVYASRSDLAHQVHAHGIAAERKECRVSEAQNSAVSPDQIDRQRQHGVTHVLANERERIGRKMKRRCRRYELIENRYERSPAAATATKKPGAARDPYVCWVIQDGAEASLEFSDERPVCGNSPRGRAWIKRISATSTKIFASTAPEYGSSSLLTIPIDMPPMSAPQRFPTPPKTTTMNESIMYDCPRFGPTLVNWLSATPATPAIPEPSPKRHRIHPFAANAHGCGHRAVLRHGADIEAEPGAFQHRHNCSEDEQRKDDDVKPVVRDRKRIIDLQRAAHPFGRFDRPVQCGKNRTHELLQDQAHAERRKQRLEWSSIKKSNDRALNQNSGPIPKP